MHRRFITYTLSKQQLQDSCSNMAASGLSTESTHGVRDTEEGHDSQAEPKRRSERQMLPS